MSIRYAALIPIKDHSERVPGKNFRDLCGRPLWQHIVYTLSRIDAVAKIFIDTDSLRFTEEALAPFPKVRIIPRPAGLRGDFVSTNSLFAHDLAQIDSVYTHFLQTHTTNPLLTAATIERAMNAFETGKGDSLFSVTAHQSRFYWQNGEAVNHNPAELLRTQDLPPLMEENSNLYLFTRQSFAKKNTRIGTHPMLFEMDKLEAVDIDDEESWRLAELLLRNQIDTKEPE